MLGSCSEGCCAPGTVFINIPGTRQTYYTYSDNIDELLSRSVSGSTGWYLTDRLGSVRQVTNLAGTVMDAITYDGFGKVVSESGPSYGDRFKWTGREWNSDTGLQYNRSRYYLNETGRWLSEDPIRWDAGDVNLYRYVGNASTSYVDPMGTDPSGPGGGLGDEPTGGGAGLFWGLATIWSGSMWGGTNGSGGCGGYGIMAGRDCTPGDFGDGFDLDGGPIIKSFGPGSRGGRGGYGIIAWCPEC